MNDSPLNWSEFLRVEMLVGTILKADVFEEARIPAYKMEIDFGPKGVKKSSAQITKNYAPEKLVGQQIVAVVNFPPKQIANLMSECLVLGAVEDHNFVTLISPTQRVANGTRIG